MPPAGTDASDAGELDTVADTEASPVPTAAIPVALAGADASDTRELPTVDDASPAILECLGCTRPQRHTRVGTRAGTLIHQSGGNGTSSAQGPHASTGRGVLERIRSKQAFGRGGGGFFADTVGLAPTRAGASAADVWSIPSSMAAGAFCAATGPGTGFIPHELAVSCPAAASACTVAIPGISGAVSRRVPPACLGGGPCKSGVSRSQISRENCASDVPTRVPSGGICIIL